MTLEDLRTQIKEQLSGGDILPHEYVFLRAVGRCLAIVIIFNTFPYKHNLHIKSAHRLKFSY